MIIKQGYWNYYIAFRVQNKTYLNHVMKGEEFSSSFEGVVAAQIGDEQLFKSSIDEILEERKQKVVESRQKYGEEDSEKLWELYCNTELPEMYFDFDEDMNDRLSACIKDTYSTYLHKYIESCRLQLGNEALGKLMTYCLMPIKIYLTDFDFVYCPVFLFFTPSGNGVAKIQIPIINVDSSMFKTIPLRKWFGDVKVWEALTGRGKRNEYKIMAISGDDTIELIRQLLTSFVKTIFDDSSIEPDRTLGFESLVFSETDGPDLIHGSKMDQKRLDELYHLSCPERFGDSISKDKVLTFWNDRHHEVAGITIVEGESCRLLFMADPIKIAGMHGTEVATDYLNDYFENSLSFSFDLYIFIALAVKDNEVTIYRFMDSDGISIRQNRIHLLANENYLESMLLQVMTQERKFYTMVRRMLDEAIIDISSAIDRFEKIDEIERQGFTEKHDELIRLVTFIFTGVFGLPLIQETLSILKQTFINAIDIPVISVNLVSVILWLTLIGVMIIYNRKR